MKLILDTATAVTLTRSTSEHTIASVNLSSVYHDLLVILIKRHGAEPVGLDCFEEFGGEAKDSKRNYGVVVSRSLTT